MVAPPLTNLHLDVHLTNEALRALQILASELDGERIVPVMRRRLIPTHGDPDHGSALAGQCDRRAQDIAPGDAPDPFDTALGGPSLRLNEGQTVQRRVNPNVTAEHLGNWHERVDHTQVNNLPGAHRRERRLHPDTWRNARPYCRVRTMSATPGDRRREYPAGTVGTSAVCLPIRSHDGRASPSAQTSEPVALRSPVRGARASRRARSRCGWRSRVAREHCFELAVAGLRTVRAAKDLPASVGRTGLRLK